MENLKIKATNRTPDILFDCENDILEIKGKSYPSNITWHSRSIYDHACVFCHEKNHKK